ncbi:hypothetical protein BGW36DRAFT_135540 [Talaromyces proteolyticus]|uniref:Uncharacterized protein n=1 Tax=Talaromyces proteolyticus TaxID=1131652 RepID=A0AAD4KWH8_9EURO|nr:uncharacterized protein BGW36DRAFT_135540 [Talaromyces proteolyticus]KAH8700773.1 hypothetical protein BGW36DRAFT_135540 [Talaromyces proteolyticus]
MWLNDWTRPLRTKRGLGLGFLKFAAVAFPTSEDPWPINCTPTISQYLLRIGLHCVVPESEHNRIPKIWMTRCLKV